MTYPHTHTHNYSNWGVSLSSSPSEHDECASGQNLCDENAICTNTIRGHLCTCKPGYVGNGTICRGNFPLWNIPPDTQTPANTRPEPSSASFDGGWLLWLCNITVSLVHSSFTSANQAAAAAEMMKNWSGASFSLFFHTCASSPSLLIPAPCWPVAPPRRLTRLAQCHTDGGEGWRAGMRDAFCVACVVESFVHTALKKSSALMPIEALVGCVPSSSEQWKQGQSVIKSKWKSASITRTLIHLINGYSKSFNPHILCLHIILMTNIQCCNTCFMLKYSHLNAPLTYATKNYRINISLFSA